MKRLKFLLIPLTMGLVSLASCGSDNNDNEQVGPESGDVTSFDQVKFLQNNIVEIDSLGNMVQRVSGIPLNDADTTVLSIKVADVDAAKKMFESWLSPDTKTELISPSTVDVKAALKDEDGNVKETVYFKTVTDGNDIAEMTFAGSGVFKHFSKVKFVTAWSGLFTEGRSPYTVGQTELFDAYEEKTPQKWVCIKEAKDGVAGMMMYISNYKTAMGTNYLAGLASPSLAKAASDVLRTDWDKYVEYFKNAGRTLESGEYYWIDDWTFRVVVAGFYGIRLSDGDIDWFHCMWVTHKDRKPIVQVRTFGLVNG